MSDITISSLREFARNILFENNLHEYSARPDDGHYIQNSRQGGAINSPMIDGDNNYHSIKDEDEDLTNDVTETANGMPYSSDDIVPINSTESHFEPLGIEKVNNINKDVSPTNKVELKKYIAAASKDLDFNTDSEYAEFWKDFSDLIEKNKQR